MTGPFAVCWYSGTPGAGFPRKSTASKLQSVLVRREWRMARAAPTVELVGSGEALRAVAAGPGAGEQIPALFRDDIAGGSGLGEGGALGADGCFELPGGFAAWTGDLVVAGAAGRGASDDGDEGADDEFGSAGVDDLGDAGLGETIAPRGRGETAEVDGLGAGGDCGGVDVRSGGASSSVSSLPRGSSSKAGSERDSLETEASLRWASSPSRPEGSWLASMASPSTTSGSSITVGASGVGSS